MPYNKLILLLSTAICIYLAWSAVTIFILNKKTEFFTLFKKAPFLGKQYEALVVSCIDMTKEQRSATDAYLISKGYADNYLSYMISNDEYTKEIKKTLHNTIDKSIQNYNIQEIIIIGHMSCIALRKMIGLDKISEPKETRWASKNLKIMKNELTQKYRKKLIVSIHLLNTRNIMEDVL